MGLLALLCFFFSGASGLIFEVVWTRELGLVFGSTTLAISTVLSVYMGGLALGSLIAGRYADRVKDPLRFYALVEGGVGLYGLGIPLLLQHYPSLNAAMYRAVGEQPLSLSLLRFLATALLLLPPTTLMGATLPLLSRHLVARQDDFGRLGVKIGTLYAANTLGAVLGTFLAGFVLLPLAGVVRTNATAAFTNIGLLVVILVVRAIGARRRRAIVVDEEVVSLDDIVVEPEPAPEPSPDEAPPPSPADVTPLQRRVALFTFACSGAAAMIYQVLWSRALAIVIGSSVYSFSLILLAFLVGLSFGATVWSRLAQRSRNPVAWLAATHLGVVAMVVLSYFLIDKLPGAFVALLRGGTFSVDGILGVQFVLAALAVLPCTVFLGGVMPLTVRIYTSGLDRVGRDVGDAYSVNTLGAIIGSFAAGFVVLPVLGLQRGLFFAAVASAAIAGVLVLVSAGRRWLRFAIAGTGVLATVACALFLPRWDLGHFQAGLFRVSIAKDIVESGKWPVPELLYYHDGISTTVSVERWGKHLALKNNGKVDASNGDDMPTQIMVGLMPLLFHPTALEKPPRVAVIGYGSGVTIGAVTQFPIAHADVVELEPEIVYASRWFAGYVPGFPDVNHRPDEDPRVRVVIDDGRNFLTRSSGDDDRYDVIVSEPSNPWITGVSNLFTRDYWELARKRLRDDGVFCQWAQLYEMSPRNIKTILHTFAEVFPYTYVFSAEDLSSDVIMVAANHPLPLDRQRLAKNFVNDRLRAELARGAVKSADDIIAYLLLTPAEIGAYTAGTDVNTDDNALIEFGAPRDLLGYVRYDPYLSRVYGHSWPYGRIEPYLTGLGDGSARGEAEARIAESLLRHGKRSAASRFVGRATTDGGGPKAAHAALLLKLLSEKRSADPELPLATDDDPLDPPRLPQNLAPDAAETYAKDYAMMEDETRRRRWAHALGSIARARSAG